MKFSVMFLTALLLCCSGGAAAQEAPVQPAINPQKLAAINDLLELTGAIKLSQQMLVRMIEAQKKGHPEIDAKVWDRYQAKLNVSDMVGSIAAIYDRHFSTEDLVATATFYRSAAGQRMIKEMPAVMSEAMAVGQEWGRQKSAELMKEIKEEAAHPTKLG
jgi:uncharacterized protein